MHFFLFYRDKFLDSFCELITAEQFMSGLGKAMDSTDLKAEYLRLYSA